MSTACEAVSTRAVGVAIGALLMLSAPAAVAAQQACSFAEGTERLRSTPDPRGGGNITRLTRPHFLCEGDVELWSDSTVVYSRDQLALLYGSVRYLDGQREMHADNGRYYYDLGNFEAQGNLFVTNHEDGSTVENGELLYLRQTETRDVEEMTFTTGADRLRPHATVYPKRVPPADSTETGDVGTDAAADPVTSPDSAAVLAAPAADLVAASDADQSQHALDGDAPPAEPEAYDVVADRLFFRGDFFDATGDVEIVRDSLFAFADFAQYEGEVGELVLDGSARVEGSGYDLVGRTITLASAADGSDEVRARRDAVLTGEDLNVTAPQIVLHLVDGELERMVAVPLPEAADSTVVRASAGAGDDPRSAPPRPSAISQDMQLTGDSLDLVAPGGALERILAAGTARSVSATRAELNIEELPEMARQDWMEGDTIEVFLVPTVGEPSAQIDEAGGDYEVDQIIARVRARSLYRLTPSDSTAVRGVDPPALSYIVADRITIFMVGGQADRVESVGQVTGWHLEPLPRRPPEDADGSADGSAEPAEVPEVAADSTDAPIPAGTGNGGDGAPPDAYLFPGP